MKASEFCYWLQGWFELNETIDHREGATQETLEVIKRHLNLVFVHDIDPQQVKDKLQQIHDGGLKPEPATSETVYRC